MFTHIELFLLLSLFIFLNATMKEYWNRSLYAPMYSRNKSTVLLYKPRPAR